MGLRSFISKNKEALATVTNIGAGYLGATGVAVGVKALETTLQTLIDAKPWLSSVGVLPLATFNAVTIGGAAVLAYYAASSIEKFKRCTPIEESQQIIINHTNASEYLIDIEDNNQNENKREDEDMIAIWRATSIQRTTAKIVFGSAAAFLTSLATKSIDNIIHIAIEDNASLPTWVSITPEGLINGFLITTAVLTAAKSAEYIVYRSAQKRDSDRELCLPSFNAY